jgi:hypothetical protein
MKFLKASLLLITLLSTLGLTAGCFVEDEDHDHGGWHRREEIHERHFDRDRDHGHDWR